MKKLLVVISLLLLFVSVSGANLIEPSIKLSYIDFPAPSAFNAIYINIYNATSIPNFLVLLKGTNVTFDASKIIFMSYSGHGSYIYVSDDIQFLFTSGNFPTKSVNLVFMQLFYTENSPIYSIELIAVRPFSLGSVNYPKDSIIDSIVIPEPMTIIILSFGFLILKNKR